MGKTITAVNIKKLWHGDPTKISSKVTGATLFALLKNLTEVKNVHQDTWTLEEAEANKTAYKNQLTGKVYRSDKEMGEVKMNFTLGEMTIRPRQTCWVVQPLKLRGSVPTAK